MILISWQKPSEHLPTNIFPFINYYCLWLLRTIVHQQKKQIEQKLFSSVFFQKKHFMSILIDPLMNRNQIHFLHMNETNMQLSHS
jgi:hypothetical protein